MSICNSDGHSGYLALRGSWAALGFTGHPGVPRSFRGFQAIQQLTSRSGVYKAVLGFTSCSAGHVQGPSAAGRCSTGPFQARSGVHRSLRGLQPVQGSPGYSRVHKLLGWALPRLFWGPQVVQGHLADCQSFRDFQGCSGVYKLLGRALPSFVQGGQLLS